MWASRAAFVLKVWGFNEVAVLDGGFASWGNHQVESGEGKIGEDTNFEFVYHPELVAEYDDIKAIVTGQSQCQIVDARPGALSGGHIPGSLSLAMPTLLTPDNKFKSAAEIQALFESAGITRDKPIVFSCGGGVQATVLAIAANQLGYIGSKVYDGSWPEYQLKS